MRYENNVCGKRVYRIDEIFYKAQVNFFNTIPSKYYYFPICM